MRKKRIVNRWIAFGMAVIMLLSLIAYDNRFAANALNDEEQSADPAVIDVMKVIEKAGEDANLMELTAYFSGESVQIQGGEYLLYDMTKQELNGTGTTEEDTTEEGTTEAETTEEVTETGTTEADTTGEGTTEAETTEEVTETGTTEAETTEEGTTEAETTEKATETGTTEAETTEEETTEEGTTEAETSGSDIEKDLKEEITIDAVSQDKLVIALYVQKKRSTDYEQIGKLTLYKDSEAPKIDEVTVITGDTVKAKDEYYLAAKAAEVEVRVKASDLEGTGSETEYVSGIESVVAKTKGGEEIVFEKGESDTYTGTLVKAGVYTIAAYDQAGNETVYKDTIDIRNPKEIKNVTVEYCVVKPKAELHYLLVPKDRIDSAAQTAALKVEITETKAGESVDRILYFSVEDGISGDVEIKNNTAEITIPVSQASTKDGLNWLKLRIVDEVGQEYYPHSEDGHIIFMEEADPDVTADIQLTNAKAEKTVYSDTEYEALSKEEKWAKEIGIHVAAEGRGSLIKDVSYSLDNGKKVVLKKDTGVAADPSGFTWESEQLELTKLLGKDGKHDITFKVTDYFDNQTTYQTTLYLDTTAPEVSADSTAFGKSVTDIETTEVRNDRQYYCLTDADASETITVKAADTNSGIRQLTVTVNGEAQEIKEGADTFTFTEDTPGYYDVTIQALDYAGNESEVTEFGFMINNGEIQTSLSAEVYNTETKNTESLGESGASAYTRFKAAAVTYTATGLGLKAENIINDTTGPSDIVWEEAKVESDKNNPDLKTVTITGILPDAEGLYQISFGVKKPGSAKTAASDSLQILYDKTKPSDFVLEMTEPYGRVEETPDIYYFRTVPEVTAGIKDNYSIESFILKDDQKPEHTWIITDADSSVEDWDDGAEIRNHKIELSGAEKNQVCYLSYEAADKAGNIVTGETGIGFVYDDVAPKLTVSEVGEWNKEDVTLSVEASDAFYVSRLETEVYRDGRKVESLSGDNKDFTVGKETKNSLVYSREGSYRVRIQVYDAAGNISETVTRSFTIDKTAPEVSAYSAAFGGKSVENIKTTETYNGKDYYCLTNQDASETITVQTSDDGSSIRQLTVTVNGEEQEIKEGENTFVFTETEPGYYDVTVQAADYAGNESRVLEFGFMINSRDIQTSLSAEVYNTETEAMESLGVSGSSAYTRFKGAVITYTATGLGISIEDITYGKETVSGMTWNEPVITEDAENPDMKTITITGTLPDQEEIYDIAFSVRKPGSESGVVHDSMRIIYDKTMPFDFVLTAAGTYGTLEETPETYYYNTTPKILVELKDNYSIERFVLADDQTPEHKWVIVDADSAIEELDGYAEVSDYELELDEAIKNEWFRLTFDAEDKAGNHIIQEMESSFVYDDTAPEITVDEIDYWNNQDVSLQVDVKDEFYVSRLETEVYRNGEKIQSISGDYAGYAPFTIAKETRNALDYSEEGVYSVTVLAYDAAGNVSESVTKSFVIDKTPPEVTWSGIPSEPNRSNGNVTVGFSVKDEYGINPENSGSGNQGKVIITRYYKTFDGITGKDAVTITDAGEKSMSAGSVCGQMTDKACSYYFEIEAVDNAGNSEGILRTPDFYIDRTAPEFTISPLPSKTNLGYYNEMVSFDVNVTEQYAFAHTVRVVDKNAGVNGGNCVRLANSTVNEKTGTCRVSVDTANAVSGTFALTVIVTDIFGNQTQKDISFVIDKQEPVITLGSVAGVNRGDVTIPVTISDDYRYGSYNIEVVRLDASGREVYHNRTYRSGRWENSRSIDFSETFAEEGDYTVTVTAVDQAGNKAVAGSTAFRIDRNAPVLSITGISDTQTSACTATLSIDDSFAMGYQNSTQNASANVDITRKTDSSPETTIANLTYSNFSGTNPHTASYSFSEDGIYTITFDAVDASGNRAPSVTRTFKVDTTAPDVTVSVADKNAAAVGSYEAVGSTDAGDPNYVVMNVNVVETFFTTNHVTFTVKKDGVDVSGRYFTGYANRGETSSVSQLFEEDGVYTVTITAVDELGNAADEYHIVFKVDNTAPTMENTAVLDAFRAKADADGNILLNGEDFAAIAELGYEAFWNVNDTSVFTVDVKMDGVDFIDFSDLSDGYHKMTITVTDEVGHQSVEEFEFTYDGTAPRIIVKGIENGESATEPFTLAVSLENPDDRITRIMINGETIDPALYEETNTYEYYVNEYGDYEIIVDAADTAGNTSSTYNSKTGEVFSFQLKEETNLWMWIVIIIGIVLLITCILILIIRSGKKRKQS